ncbi:GGDEF domain-containing protein [Pelovirga terrestris]|uniref:diguanylate cyclase n=1 Tax=Pelovirga terrestris TaxID=2771352 RepID=A0A8J6UGX2_9BACT|nr:GGDEF domain-containing protein [Pelovirga terrestris]MBD1400543.1 diguanylate cyclase [Pelovirga terrestris]
MNLLIALMLSFGSLFLLVSLIPVARIINHPGAKDIVNYWRLLTVLICLFLCGYLAYAWFHWWTYRGPVDLIVPTIFFFGAVFVLLVTVLTLKTTQALQRTFQLERDSIMDSLLGIYNRSYLDRRLPEQFSSAKRYGHDLSVLMIDIDHFKSVNDNWGHQIGDQVLQNVTRMIKNRVRETDILCRYGGEELFILLPHTGGSEAMTKAEMIRTEIETGADCPQVLTVSIGVAAVSNQVGSAPDLVWQADMALYRAKNGGRNRCEFYSPPVS